MRSTQKKAGSSANGVKKVAKRIVKKAAPRASAKRAPGRTKRFVDSTPARLLMGASAIAFAFVVAKLKHLV
jgi:hypothetical protein